MAQRKLKLNEIRAHLKSIHGLIAESDAAMEGGEAEESPPSFEGKPDDPAMDDGSGVRLSSEVAENIRRFGITSIINNKYHISKIKFKNRIKSKHIRFKIYFIYHQYKKTIS